MDRQTEKQPSLRQEAMLWWFTVEYMQQSLTEHYYRGRECKSLTGREIQEIHRLYHIKNSNN